MCGSHWGVSYPSPAAHSSLPEAATPVKRAKSKRRTVKRVAKRRRVTK